MKTKSIRLKISILFTIFLGVILVFFSIYPILKIQKILEKEQRDALLSKAQLIDKYLNIEWLVSSKGRAPLQLFGRLFNVQSANGKPGVIQLLRNDIQSLGLSKDIYRIRNDKDIDLLHSSNFISEAERKFNIKFTKTDNTPNFFYVKIKGIKYCGINYPFILSNRNGLILQLAMPIAYAQGIFYNMILSFSEGLVIILFFGVFMAKYLTDQVLKPVEEITKTAKNISQSNLNSRILIHRYDKEMEDLAEAFNQMIGRLESSFAYINEFNSMVSHEMKTPLAIIKGELEMALEADYPKEKNKRIMQGVLDEVYRLIKTIKDMLLLAEYEYKLGILNMEKMDIVPLLQEIFEHSKVLAEDKEINMGIVLPQGQVWIEGDATHLRRVFFNLINNAVKFTPEGGEIDILTEIHDAHVAVSIKDSGIGIPAENQARIFEKFYRGNPAKQKKIEGSGLGLSIARAITQAHRGTITFESTVNKGTTFKVCLPLLPQ
ncbi:MAG: HAMP domain-containing protein [Candidatus Omnitrophica bacterium]|nr:HAMP domain-containing protein [Candidatus Omnitrophota bacterium]MDE2008859.1 HAMP domain-containing protein [Candidatus Omnitrophota bacterium]MDE2213578.1 HAMP domain-containing protein [Candidatus Omnitrophota bacterium]MDE2230521.1 HAMP domain-containing protein [Candidatus Omnitrophota bacterium]